MKDHKRTLLPQSYISLRWLEREIAERVPHMGSIQRSIAPEADSTTELRLAADVREWGEGGLTIYVPISTEGSGTATMSSKTGYPVQGLGRDADVKDN